MTASLSQMIVGEETPTSIPAPSPTTTYVPISVILSPTPRVPLFLSILYTSPRSPPISPSHIPPKCPPHPPPRSSSSSMTH